MRILRFLLQKEFKQIFRNKAILAMVLVMPTIQLLILPLTADLEVKNISIVIIDNDHSTYSHKLAHSLQSSSYFKLSGTYYNYKEAFEQFEQNKADIILEIPNDFEKNLIRENAQKIRIAVNAINGIKAGLGANYIQKILFSFNEDILLDWFTPERYNASPTITVATTNWFNTYYNFKMYMVPGFLVLLVTIVGAMLCSANIVQEKENGTIEQINVTPIKKYIFILGKLIPFLLLGIFVFSMGLFIVARLVYGIVPIGDLLALYTYLIVYLIGMLGFGLIISTYSNTQQQAMSLIFFFMMIFILMCGLFTPIDSMPLWAQVIARLNPVTYFIEVIRMIILKGSGFADISRNLLISGGFAIVFNGWAIWNYKKRG